MRKRRGFFRAIELAMRRYGTDNRFVRTIRYVTALAVVVLASPSARADISFLNAFDVLSYQQTGNGNSLSLNGAFYSVQLTASTPGEYSSVTMTYPGPSSSQNLPEVAGGSYFFQTGFFANQAALAAAYPFGLYSFTANGSPTNTASYNYTSSDYPQSLPYLTGNDYSNLQGMNPSKAFTLDLNAFITGSQANFSYIFVTVTDLTKNTVAFTEGFLSPGTTSVVIPAHTLTPGDHFDYQIDYSNRDNISSTGSINGAQLGFDIRTDGTFTAGTATP